MACLALDGLSASRGGAQDVLRDRALSFRQDEVVEVGPPAQIFDAPRSPCLKDFAAKIVGH